MGSRREKASCLHGRDTAIQLSPFLSSSTPEDRIRATRSTPRFTASICSWEKTAIPAASQNPVKGVLGVLLE